jgi:pimeloyl-ACP methyl ester carboxylesterase
MDGAANGRTAVVDGIPVRWLEEDGQGVPVVLVHGIPTSPALWRHVRPRLTGLRVLAFEMTGYGDGIPAGREL